MDGVQAFLLLGKDAAAAGGGAVAGLGHGSGGHLQHQLGVFGLDPGQRFVVSGHIALRAQHVLHIAGAGLGPVFVVAVGEEQLPHSPDVEQDLLRSDGLGHLQAHLGVGAQAAGAVHVEGTVGTGGKAQVTEGDVGDVGGAVGEANLELAGHFPLTDEGHEVLAGGLGPGEDVEVLALFHAGEGGDHGISGKIAAAAPGDDAHVQGLFHDGEEGVGLEVVELDGLAGGEVELVHPVLPDAVGHEGQLFLIQPTAGGPQAEHTRLAALLGVAAEAAGEAFILFYGGRAGIETAGRFLKCGKIFLPALGINVKIPLIHTLLWFLFCVWLKVRSIIASVQRLVIHFESEYNIS